LTLYKHNNNKKTLLENVLTTTVKRLDKLRFIQKHKDQVNSELHLKHSELLKRYKNTLNLRRLDYY